MIDITFHNTIQWGAGKNNEGGDFSVFTSHLKTNFYDLLIFTDSKGSNLVKTEKSWTQLLFESYENDGYKILLICRPKEMTVFFSLMNFIQENNFQFNYLITNLGFVDLTPKKQSYIQDIFDQKPIACEELPLGIIDLCEYKLSNGCTELLKTVNYQHIEGAIAQFISTNFKKSFLIGVFEFTERLRIDRKRPKHFFTQLKQSNTFIERITESHSNISFLPTLVLQETEPESISFDAVHLSEFGHRVLYEIILGKIDMCK